MENRSKRIRFNKRTIENHHKHQERMMIVNNNHHGDYQVAVQVTIIKAVGIDKASRQNHASSFNRLYNVVYWVVPGEELRTQLTSGSDPIIWNEKGLILLDNLDEHVFLNVEVQRFRSKVDPGTSSGKVVVGRARIPLPKKAHNRNMVGEFPLVKIEGEHPKAEGHIVIGLSLQIIKLTCKRAFT